MNAKESDIIIIGAGIVGLSTAYQLLEKKANQNLKILILEKEKRPAFHQTGRNSGVIHSGIYYKKDSEKAINCINGYRRLIDFCNQNKVPYELCGKIIVATSTHEKQLLAELGKRALDNGLEKIKLLTSKQIRNYEPYVKGEEGLFVPQTGIIDYSKVCEVLIKLIENYGAKITYNQKVNSINKSGDKVVITTQKQTFITWQLVNCAGLYADKVAKMANTLHADYIRKRINAVKIIPFRGEYYKLKNNAKYLINHLVYPVPDPKFPFLGVHFTRMLNGEIKAGPNAVLAFAREGYTKSEINCSELLDILLFQGFWKLAKKHWKKGLMEMKRSYSRKAFTMALQKMLPMICEDDLEIVPAGVRAQACSIEGKLLDDFEIVKDNQLIHVLNAPSPAATSSLSIGQSIATLLS